MNTGTTGNGLSRVKFAIDIRILLKQLFRKGWVAFLKSVSRYERYMYKENVFDMKIFNVFCLQVFYLYIIF